MKSYNSFGELAKTLERCTQNLEVTIAEAMKESAVLVEEAAKGEIGHYQRENMGNDVFRWEPWQELKQGTKNDRLRQGYTENDPLDRSGELRESITHEALPKAFTVGSESKILLWQELGTQHIAPRSVLGIALFRNTKIILNLLGSTIEKTLAGEK